MSRAPVNSTNGFVAPPRSPAISVANYSHQYATDAYRLAYTKAGLLLVKRNLKMLNGKKRYPMKNSSASSIPDGYVARSTIVRYASLFDLVIGMPRSRRRRRTFRERLAHKPLCSVTIEVTHSYYSKGILYLTPDDYKAWVTALEHERRMDAVRPSPKKEISNASKA